MSGTEKKIPIPKELTETGLQTQTEKLPVQTGKTDLSVGIPCERNHLENRVALVPSSVANLTAQGIRVIMERGAGERTRYSDHRFSEAGAEIVYSAEEVYRRAQVIVKVAPPTLDELDWMRPSQLLISALQLPMLTDKYLKKLLSKRVIALAMEYVKDEDGTFPIVRIMSEMAGMSAMLTAADLMTTTRGGKGVLLGGISGVPSAKVVILGAGVVAEFATRVALGLGAEVRIFDNNVRKLMRIQSEVGHQLNTSTMNPYQMRKEIISADVVIGAIHAKNGRTPVVVSEEWVSEMKRGAVIIDVSIDQGGCFATSRVTTHDDPTFVEHDVIHYCVPNMSSKVARTASIAVSNILTAMLLDAGETANLDRHLFDNKGLRHGVYCYKGRLTNEYLARRFNVQYTDLSLLLTSDL